MDDYISKPIKPTTFFEKVEEFAINGLSDRKEPEKAQETTMEKKTGFDRVAALMQLEGDEELLEELAGLFLKGWRDRKAEIRGALDSGDVETFTRGAHTLKSAAGNLAAREAFTAALNLETAGRQGDLDAARAAWGPFESEINRLVSGLEAFVKEGCHAGSDSRG